MWVTSWRTSDGSWDEDGWDDSHGMSFSVAPSGLQVMPRLQDTPPAAELSLGMSCSGQLKVPPFLMGSFMESWNGWKGPSRPSSPNPLPFPQLR